MDNLIKVGIYKRKQESKKERKQAFDQESDQEKNEKTITFNRKVRNTFLTKKVRFKKKR